MLLVLPTVVADAAADVAAAALLEQNNVRKSF